MSDANGWTADGDAVTVTVRAQGIFIDGEFFEDDPAPEVQTD